jgi:lipid-A-disaccharide synthase
MDHRTSFIIAASDINRLKLIRELTEGIPGPANIEIVAGKTRDILREADAAMVTSGTATIETALLRCPMVVVYKLNPLSYSILKRLVKVDYIGMVNIMAERELCPELIQAELTPQNLAQKIYPLTHDTPERTAMLAGFDEVIARLGEGGTAGHAARIILDEIHNSSGK